MLQFKIAVIARARNIFHFLVLLPLMLVPLFFLSACGKKGEPTLKEFEKPSAPSDLRAIHREKSIILQWNYPKDKEESITEFILFKSSDTEFRELVHLEKNKRIYEDTDFFIGGNYSYKIIARNFRGVYSDESNVITVKPLAVPPPPSDLSFSIRGNSLSLTWKSAGNDLLHNVYKTLEKGSYGMSPVNSVPLAENSFSDTFNINKTVYYTVRSLLTPGIRDEGLPSEELVADPSELVPTQIRDLRYYAAPDRVFLYWKEPEESWVTHFRIFRRTEGQDYQLIGETQLPVFVDAEPAVTKKDYRVTAVGPTKEGPGAEVRGVISLPQ
jgi:hypothetical protein